MFPLGKNRSSFTLIELLVVLALVAILSVVVILTLNPAELIKQARDSNRLSDLATINTALNLFSADVTSGFMGTSTVVYISIPDTSPTCANLGLPTSTAYTYNCVTAANLRNTDGTGWIPVNFQRISSNSPVSQLPIDPINTTTTGNYYVYVTGGSWVLTAIPESAKQKTELSTNPNLSKFPGVIGMGNNLDISPLYNPNGLVGYWKFDEGSGATAKDSSGNGNDGVVSNPAGWTSGKIGYGIDLNQSSQLVTIPDADFLDIPNTLTIALWTRQIGSPTGDNGGYFLQKMTNTNDANYALNLYSHDSWCPDCRGLLANAGGTWNSMATYITLPLDENWHFFVTTYDSSANATYYVNGEQVRAQAASGILAINNRPITLGEQLYPTYHMNLDDLRIYNRVLTPAEILALYNATK